MKPSRRKLLRLTAGAAMLPALYRFASAQTYPDRPVHIVCGFAEGGPQDYFAHFAAEILSQRLNQPFVVETVLGEGGNAATDKVVNAAADGYTLLLVGPPNAINATLYPQLSFNFLRDVAPIAGIARMPNAMEVNPTFPARTVPDFIAYAKAHPGTIKMASGGNGTIPHVAGELFQIMTGTKLIHVPYRGEILSIPDLLADKVQLVFGSMTWSAQYIKDGKLKALAVTTATRSDVFPDLPTVGAFVPGYEASAWYGLGAPKGTPPDLIAALNEAIGDGLITPVMRERLADLGGRPLLLKPAEFGKLVSDETDKWGNVIRTAHIQLD